MVGVTSTRSYSYLPAIVAGTAFLAGLFLTGRGLKEIYKGIPLQELRTLAGLKAHRAVVYQVAGGLSLSAASLALGLVSNRTPKKPPKVDEDHPPPPVQPTEITPRKDDLDAGLKDKESHPSSSDSDEEYFSVVEEEEDPPLPTPEAAPIESESLAVEPESIWARATNWLWPRQDPNY